MLQRIVGYKENREYFWPVNIPMDATTRPDRFLFVKMSDNLDLIQIEKFKNPVSVSDDYCLQHVHQKT